MDAQASAAERKVREEKELSARAMHVLTGGLTTEADTLLIGATAVLLMSLLWPAIGGWSLLAFPVLFLAAVLGRVALDRRKND